MCALSAHTLNTLSGLVHKRARRNLPQGLFPVHFLLWLWCWVSSDDTTHHCQFVSSDVTTIVKTCTSCGEFVNDIAPPPHFMKWHWIERYIKVVSSQFQNVTLLFCKNEKVFKSFYFPSSFCTDDVCGGRGNEIWLLVVWMCHHFSLFVKSTSNQQENWNFSKSKEKIQICLTFPHYIRISNPVGRKRRIKWILKQK